MKREQRRQTEAALKIWLANGGKIKQLEKRVCRNYQPFDHMPVMTYTYIDNKYRLVGSFNRQSE